ncbi:hypothetical protein L6452_42086 [Arctium lappa]|uniref:Uncharacterized protein n=1 Tax=Arctium lappa TaxID=4217 RepID=A0ACB8XHS5_ARCLA|nr:hypothetical protein L6452_42086 [Arctium lappa]
MEQNLKLNKGDEENLVDASSYRRLVGRLLYLQVTRPDIMYAVNVLSQFVSDPKQNHLDATTRVLCYLKSTPGQGILLPTDGGTDLTAYSDSDWLGCPFSRPEYQAMATTVSEVLWVLWLLTELDIRIDKPTPLFCDNELARHISHNLVFHERTKHVEMDCYFVRERVESKEVAPVWIDTRDLLADLLTKALGSQRLHSLLIKLGIRNLHAPT